MLAALFVCATAVAAGPGRAEDWDALRRQIDAYGIIEDCVVTVGDTSGVLFEHGKGAARIFLSAAGLKYFTH